MTTLQEVDEHWDINDLADANEALDIKAEAEWFKWYSIEKGKKDNDAKNVYS